MQQQPVFPPEVMAILGILIVAVVAGLVIGLAIQIFYLLTLHRALDRVSPRNRLMEPAMVWLNLIPCFNIVWQFFIAIRVPDSLRNEFRDRGRDDGSDYGKTIAMTQAIINLGGAFVGNIVSRVPDMEKVGLGISLLTSVVVLVLFIVFWIKIASYSRMLTEDEGERDRRLDQFDDEDDYGTPPPGGISPPPDTYKAGDPGQYQ
jgi:hypothetical protein